MSEKDNNGWPEGAQPVRLAAFQQPALKSGAPFLLHSLVPFPWTGEFDAGLCRGTNATAPTPPVDEGAAGRWAKVDGAAGFGWRRHSATHVTFDNNVELYGAWVDTAAGHVAHFFGPVNGGIPQWASILVPPGAEPETEAGPTRVLPDNFNFLSDAAKSALVEGVENLWTILRVTLAARIAKREVNLFARVGSPTKSPEPIPADAWAHFQMESWFRGVAVCPETGERLFSVHAVDSGRFAEDESTTVAIERKLTAAAQTRCVKWLAESMRKSPLDRPKSRRDFDKEAQALFPGLGSAGFDRAWAIAITETGAEAWRKAGRPRKNRAS